jgi:hypothetical protein
MKRFLVSTLAGLALVFAAGTAQAQVFTPTFQSPRLTNDLGLYINNGPGDLGIEGIWRGGPLGLRVGYVDAGDGMLSVGGELRNPIRIANAPLGLAFTLGVQGLIGDNSAIGAQGGLTAGYTFTPEGVAITPYVHPRIGIVDCGSNCDTEVKALADLGVDVEFYNNLIFRLGFALDDVGADFGFGLAIRR